MWPLPTSYCVLRAGERPKQLGRYVSGKVRDKSFGMIVFALKCQRRCAVKVRKTNFITDRD